MKLSNSIAGAVGEAYVKAELLRHGLIASTLYSGAKDYDLIAYNEKTNKTIKIQVKTTQSKAKQWILGKNTPYYDGDTYYVFVTLLDNKMPEYYVVPSIDVYNSAINRHNIPTKSGGTRSDNWKFTIDTARTNQYKDDWKILL